MGGGRQGSGIGDITELRMQNWGESREGRDGKQEGPQFLSGGFLHLF